MATDITKHQPENTVNHTPYFLRVFLGAISLLMLRVGQSKTSSQGWRMSLPMTYRYGTVQGHQIQLDTLFISFELPM